MVAAITANRLAFRVIDEIAAASELETADTPSLYLRAAIEGEDVVRGGDVMVAVGKHRAVLAAEDDIVLDQDLMAALVGIDSPATVLAPRNMPGVLQV